MTAWQADPMTKNQADFIRSLEAKRAVEPVPQSEFVMLTKGEASALISWLKTVPLSVAAEVEDLEKEPEAIEPSIPKGYYTVVRPDGEHRTFRVKQAQQGGLKGRWILSLLTGPDNTSSYSGVGFVNVQGVKLWNKFKGNDELLADVAVLAGLDVDGMDEAGLRYSLESGNCYICNRLLTEPLSIERGIGPVCWGNLYGGPAGTPGGDSVEEFEHTNPLMNAG